MTQEEIKTQLDQAKQDAITLDYAKWSFQQTQAKRSNDHGLWQQERDRVLNRQHLDNEVAKQRRLGSLDAARKAKQAENAADIDRRLEPQKQTMMREWLANNPNQTPADFDKKAWVHLRQNLIEKTEADALQTEADALRATGRYSL